MLPGHPGSIGIADEGGPDVLVPVRRHAHADPAGADEYSEVHEARGDLLADGVGVIRVIDRVVRVGADIFDGITFFREMRDERLLDSEAAVVGADDDGGFSVARGGGGCAGFGCGFGGCWRGLIGHG